MCRPRRRSLRPRNGPKPLRAFAFPLQVPITASHKTLDEAGNLKDKRIEGKLDLLAQEVRAFLKGGLGATAEIVAAG